MTTVIPGPMRPGSWYASNKGEFKSMTDYLDQDSRGANARKRHHQKGKNPTRLERPALARVRRTAALCLVSAFASLWEIVSNTD